MEMEMKKITIAILVVLAALCLCSCATEEKVESKYPRIYTIDSASREAVLNNAIKSVSPESIAAVGGEEAMHKAVRSQIPEGFVTITMISENRCSMMVTLSSSTNILEGSVEKNGDLVFEMGGTKVVYWFSKDKKTLMGNWYGVQIVLVYDET